MKEQSDVVHGASAKWETVGDGIRRQILAYGPDLMMVRVDFKKGAVGPVHDHPHRQASYVASGMFEVTVGGRRMTLEEGDSFFAAANVPHGVVALDEGTLIDTFTPAREDFVGKRG
jgi:quercetin dioxygenase-like cupin family protein